MVHDSSDAVVPGARVTVRNAGTNSVNQTSTSAKGEFTIVNLIPGSYEVSVQKDGFSPLIQRGLTLEVDQTARLILTMAVGTMSQTVEVKAETPMVNTENSARGDVITTQEIGEMPLQGRNFTDLAFLVAGVSQKADSDQGSPFAVNGARGDNMSFLVSGFETRDIRYGVGNIQPNLDAMQEFKMDTSGYSAEYGRTSGGVMSMVLKSGANRVHGTLFEFLRNDAVDARNFFSPHKDELRRNQFGGLLSGPVWIPRLFNGKDRTFFMFSWESYRQVAGSSQLSRVPTDLERAGNFSQSNSGKPVYLKDPFATGACSAASAAACFPGAMIPASRFDTIALKIMPYFPVQNLPGQANNYLASRVSPDNWNSFVLKFDHRLSANDSLSVQYLPRREASTNPFDAGGLGAFPTNSTTSATQAGLGYTHIFTASLVNEFRLGLRRVVATGHAADAGVNYAAQFGIPGLTSNPYLAGFPYINIRNEAILGDQYQRPTDSTVNSWQWSDAVTWVKGPHQFKFGGQILRDQDFSNNYQYSRGQLNFLGNWTGQPVADFELGLLESANRQVQSAQNYVFTSNYSLYAQDDYKVNSRVTLNLGLRYELPIPLYDKYGRWANFVPQTGKLLVSSTSTIGNLDALAASNNLSGKLGVASDYGYPQAIEFTNKHDFAPRFGLAWRPFGGNRTVVRGGYGIYYSVSYQQSFITNQANIYPFAQSQNVNRVTTDPTAVTLQNPFLQAKTQASLTTNGYDPSAAPQYAQAWNLTIEHELTGLGVVETAYGGSKGTHLTRVGDVNQPDYAAPPPYVHPFASITGNAINFETWDGNSTYSAGTITLRRRFTHGFFYRINYTFSKSLDEGSQVTGGGASGPQRVQDPHNRDGERGRSNWDARHVFTTNFSYLIPWHAQRFWAKPFEGWQFSGTGRASSGRPFTPRVSNVNLNLGGAVRPNRIASGALPNPTPQTWFDVSAFPAIPQGAFGYGSSGRNILDGPGFLGVNLSLIRNLRIREQSNLQIRWEVFNALNRANFGQPIAFVDSPTGGTITTTQDPRLMQFGLRYQF